MARSARKSSPLKPADIFTRAAHDTWTGTIPEVGDVNFSVIGTYGNNCDPRIIINGGPDCGLLLAIDWHTGAVLRRFEKAF